MRRRFLALAAATSILAAGCSGSTHRASPSTTGSSPSTPNPDVVPAVITPAYVNAVFVVLNRIAGDAARAEIAADAVTPGVIQDLQSIFSPPLYSIELKAYQAGLKQDISNRRDPIGNAITRVQKLIGTTSSCIFVETVTDLSSVEKAPTAALVSEYWELQRKSYSQDPLYLNSTPWAASFDQAYLSPTTLKSPC